MVADPHRALLSHLKLLTHTAFHPLIQAKHTECEALLYLTWWYFEVLLHPGAQMCGLLVLFAERLKLQKPLDSIPEPPGKAGKYSCLKSNESHCYKVPMV